MPRVFGVDYAFLSCGDVFTQGLVHAAAELGIPYAHADQGSNTLPSDLKAFRPDLLFVVHGRKFTKRWPKLVACYRSAVWLLDDPYEVDDTRMWSSAYRSVFVNDPATLHKHPGSVYLPVCYDPAVHMPGYWPRTHAVGFIGGGNQTRERYLSALTHRGLLTYVIGGPWDSPDLQRLCRSPNIPASQTATWYQQTRIIINVFRERHHYNRQQIPATAANPRIYEATACGALVISEWRPELDTLCPEMPTFRTVDECVGLVSRFAADPEYASMVQAQCALRLAPHTYAARLQAVVQTCLGEVAA